MGLKIDLDLFRDPDANDLIENAEELITLLVNGLNDEIDISNSYIEMPTGTTGNTLLQSFWRSLKSRTVSIPSGHTLSNLPSGFTYGFADVSWNGGGLMIVRLTSGANASNIWVGRSGSSATNIVWELETPNTLSQMAWTTSKTVQLTSGRGYLFLIRGANTIQLWAWLSASFETAYLVGQFGSGLTTTASANNTNSTVTFTANATFLLRGIEF